MKKTLIGLMLMSPVVALAQTPLENTITWLKTVIDMLIPLLLALAVLVFFWGLVKYLMHADDEAAKESGKTLMIWGMIALFVMVAFWAIIGFVAESIGISGAIDPGSAPDLGNVIPSL